MVFGREFAEHVARDERFSGEVWKMLTGIDLQGWESLEDPVSREEEGRGGAIHERESCEAMGIGSQHAKGCYAWATTEVHKMFAPRLDLPQGEFGQESVPLPADPLTGESLVEMERSSGPVIGFSGGAVQESIAQRGKCSDLFRGQGLHGFGVSGMERSVARCWRLMPVTSMRE